MPTASSKGAAQAAPEEKPLPAPVEPGPTGLEDLSRRVAELEQLVRGFVSGRVAEISQEEKDRETLSRRPNSYAEAVEFEAAQKRQAERDEKAGKDADEPDEG